MIAANSAVNETSYNLQPEDLLGESFRMHTQIDLGHMYLAMPEVQPQQQRRHLPARRCLFPANQPAELHRVLDVFISHVSTLKVGQLDTVAGACFGASSNTNSKFAPNGQNIMMTRART